MYRGIYTAPPNEPEGLQMIYMPDRQVIRLDGWFNNRQGMLQPVDMPLGEFLRGLGITLEDCQQALMTNTQIPAQPMAQPANVPPATMQPVVPQATVQPGVSDHTGRGVVSRK